MTRELALARRCVMILLAFSSFLTGCASDVELAVDLRTDLVAGVEFDAVGVSVDGEAEREIDVDGADAAASIRVYESRVPPGRHELRVALTLRGDEVIARALTVVIDRDSIVAAVVTRSCRSVACPGAGDPSDATECLGGHCVRPECLESAGDGCDAPECTVDGDCSAEADCATPRCVSGACLAVPRHEACEPTSYCDPDVGCVRMTSADAGVPADAAPPDAPDAGTVDSGPPDTGVSCMPPLTACGGSCIDLDALSSCGTTCANAIDCAALGAVSSATCTDGGCVIEVCDVGHANCDGVATNGCETSLFVTTSCGTSCGARVDCNTRPNVAAASCSAGSCVIVSCAPGFADCSGGAANGCETNVWADTACGLGCSGRINCTDRPNTTGGSCVSGTCEITCSPLRADCNGNRADGCECFTG